MDCPPLPEHLPVSLGTTIVATVYKGGVILAADTRTSLGTYVSNRVSDKLSQLTENIWAARSGSSADSQTLSDYLRNLLASHELQLGDQAPVKAAAKLLQQLVYRNKDGLMVGMIVGGYDKYEGASLYQITIGGTMVKTNFALSGSGSSYIYGLFDKVWKPNMTEAQAKEFVGQAVAHAMARDGGSGGCIRTVTIDANGARRDFIPSNKVPPKYGEVAPEARIEG